MILPIVKYGHPVLRKKGERIERVTPEIRQLIEDMLETMEANQGVGLAAQQIGQAIQLTQIDVEDMEHHPSTIEHQGQPAKVADFMPLVLINPEVTPAGAPVESSEGCLSFPGIYAEIHRPESVNVRALNEEGEVIEFRCGGLLARAVQHETDHLNGILFIDRMERTSKEEYRDELDTLQAATKSALKKK